jgi:hypothetical protein
MTIGSMGLIETSASVRRTQGNTAISETDSSYKAIPCCSPLIANSNDPTVLSMIIVTTSPALMGLP